MITREVSDELRAGKMLVNLAIYFIFLGVSATIIFVFLRHW
jgi:hypothetical protein